MFAILFKFKDIELRKYCRFRQRLPPCAPRFRRLFWGAYDKKNHAMDISDVTSFLAENDFSFSEAFDGFHEAWVKLLTNGEPDRFVLVPLTRGPYTEKQLKKMIGQSNIPEKIWNDWLFRNDSIVINSSSA